MGGGCIQLKKFIENLFVNFVRVTDEIYRMKMKIDVQTLWCGSVRYPVTVNRISSASHTGNSNGSGNLRSRSGSPWSWKRIANGKQVSPDGICLQFNIEMSKVLKSCYLARHEQREFNLSYPINLASYYLRIFIESHIIVIKFRDIIFLFLYKYNKNNRHFLYITY